MVEPDGSLEHGSNHDFFTFRKGMEYAVCVSLGCHTCFSKDPRRCGEAMVQVVDDAAEAAENHSFEEETASRKSDPKRALPLPQAKLVCAAKAGTLRAETRARIYDCLGAMGVKVPSKMNQRQA